ncbi:MAG: PQQ-binding-like beta-propeller repeat protein, partial [Planctomycetales bacterium]|nr:PQQ-binding-like beta-propeller repeat protein [Planctomycetales bacterium]
AGKLLWRYPFETDYECNTATPIAAAGGVLISSGENHGSALLSVTPAGGAFEVGEQWTSFGAKSTLRSEWQTPILLDGYLYGFDNVGSAGPVTHLTCVDAKTGERVWQKTRFGKGNLIAADGKLFISTMNGELVVARATPEGYQELGRQELLDSTRQAPSLANGFLYLRDNREIVCVKAAR